MFFSIWKFAPTFALGICSDLCPDLLLRFLLLLYAPKFALVICSELCSDLLLKCSDLLPRKLLLELAPICAATFAQICVPIFTPTVLYDMCFHVSHRDLHKEFAPTFAQTCCSDLYYDLLYRNLLWEFVSMLRQTFALAFSNPKRNGNENLFRNLSGPPPRGP